MDVQEAGIEGRGGGGFEVSDPWDPASAYVISIWKVV